MNIPLKYELWYIDGFSHEGYVRGVFGSEEEAMSFIQDNPPSPMYSYRIHSTYTPDENGYYD